MRRPALLAAIASWLAFLPAARADELGDEGFVDSGGVKIHYVTTGVGPGDHTACQVEFEHPKPGRDDFFAAVSGALTLNVAGDFPGAGWRTEMYQIENLAPKNAVLLFVSSADGAVYRGAVMGN